MDSSVYHSLFASRNIDTAAEILFYIEKDVHDIKQSLKHDTNTYNECIESLKLENVQMKMQIIQLQSVLKNSKEMQYTQERRFQQTINEMRDTYESEIERLKATCQEFEMELNAQQQQKQQPLKYSSSNPFSRTKLDSDTIDISSLKINQTNNQLLPLPSYSPLDDLNYLNHNIHDKTSSSSSNNSWSKSSNNNNGNNSNSSNDKNSSSSSSSNNNSSRSKSSNNNNGNSSSSSSTFYQNECGENSKVMQLQQDNHRHMGGQGSHHHHHHHHQQQQSQAHTEGIPQSEEINNTTVEFIDNHNNINNCNDNINNNNKDKNSNNSNNNNNNNINNRKNINNNNNDEKKNSNHNNNTNNIDNNNNDTHNNSNAHNNSNTHSIDIPFSQEGSNNVIDDSQLVYTLDQLAQMTLYP